MVVLFLFHPDIVPPGSIKCPHCGMFMNERYWNDYSSESKQPRILQGVDNIVVLVSIVYVCDKMVAHDDIILKSFPSADMMPFLLLHCTGFTTVVFAQHCAGEELTFTIWSQSYLKGDGSHMQDSKKCLKCIEIYVHNLFRLTAMIFGALQCQNHPAMMYYQNA